MRSSVVPGKRDVVMRSSTPVNCLIMRLINVDLPVLVTPTTYTSRCSRYFSIAVSNSSTPNPFLALASKVVTGRNPWALACCCSQFFNLLGFNDLGKTSALFPTKMTGLSPTKRCNPGITLPLKSKISMTFTINALLSPIAFRRRKKSSSVNVTGAISL